MNERTFWLYWGDKQLYVMTAPEVITNQQIKDSARREVNSLLLPLENPAKFDLMLRESVVKIQVFKPRSETNGRFKKAV